jgi:hypothetical protein
MLCQMHIFMDQFQSVCLYGVITLVLNFSFKYFQAVSRLKGTVSRDGFGF